MSAYITNLNNALDSNLSLFKTQIESTTECKNNSSGYGYLSSGRQNTHKLKDGTVIKEGLSFSPSKAATIAYFYHYDGDKLLKSYI